MKKLKNALCVMSVVLLLALLVGCSGEADERTTQSTNNTQKPTSAAKAGKDAKSGAAQAAATATPTFTPTPVPRPKTAEQPAALNRKDVAYASGVTEEWTDPETGRKCTVVEDLGEDGITRTMNCFDEDGTLVWWENYLYDVNDLLCVSQRMLPEGEAPFHMELYIRDAEGVLVRIEHYDDTPEEEGSGQYVSYVEEYYPDGKLQACRTYYPNKIREKNVEKSSVEYDKDGNETYRSYSNNKGQLLEEYINGVRNYLAPDDPFDMLKALNDASEEDFEGLWGACQEKIADKKLTAEWDELCEAYSCITDGYCQSELSRLRDEYGLILFEDSKWYNESGTVNAEALVQYLEEHPVTNALAERIYKPDSHLILGGTIWLPDEYKAVKGKRKQQERNEDDKIRVLVIDYSKTIWNETIKRSMLLDDSDNVSLMVDRAETMVDGLFEDCLDKVCLTSYPDLADVILEIRAEYPFAGTYYYSDGTPAKVWNTSITLKAVNQRGKGDTSATFKNIAGDTVTVHGGVEIYMEDPDLREDEYSGKAEKFTKTVLSWFGK